MDKVLPTILIVVVLALVFVGMAFGWRARRRTQAQLDGFAEAPAELGEVFARDELLYVSTTRADAPPERVAAGGLGFRARATATVAQAGLLLEIAGRRAPLFVPTAALRGAGRASWTIDRVIARDGLVFARWALGDAEVDTNLRPSRPDELLAALMRIAPAVPDSRSSPDSHPSKEVA